MIILGYYSKINPLFLAFFLIFNHSACEDSDAQRLPLSYVNPSDSPVIYQKHIQPLPPLQFFSCDQKEIPQRSPSVASRNSRGLKIYRRSSSRELY